MFDIFNLSDCIEIEVITNILVRPGQFVEKASKTSQDDFSVCSGKNPFGIVSRVTFNGVVVAVPHALLEIESSNYDKSCNYFTGQVLYVNGYGVLTNNKPGPDHPVVGFVVSSPSINVVPVQNLKATIKSLPLDKVVISKSSKYINGADCFKCKHHFPYAEEPNQDDGTFKCWGCRNGY